MNNMILDLIQKPNDIKKVNKEDYNELADEIRECIIENVSTNGGHLSSSLGVVELTMALHLTMNLPKDKILWDVGHQAYAHKILTGRKEAFNTLRQLNGLSGFPSLNESKCDAFGMGHASTSISAALGYVKASATFITLRWFICRTTANLWAKTAFICTRLRIAGRRRGKLRYRLWFG